MFYKFLFTILLVGFVSACSTTPKDTADTSGTGASSDESTSASSTGDYSNNADLNIDGNLNILDVIALSNIILEN